MNFTSAISFFNKPVFSSKKTLYIVYAIACILISCKVAFIEKCDNYDCFAASHFHLIQYLDLYKNYPLEYHTEYNYSPLFALLMGAFAYLPTWLGIIFWNIANTIPFVLAINLLPIAENKKIFIYWFCLIEYITAAENVQTNAAVAAFIMLVFIYQLQKNTTKSSLWYVFGVFFKVYVLTAGVFWLIFNKRLSFVVKAIGWALLFFCLPICVVSFKQLLFLYESWIHRLQAQTNREALGVLGLMHVLHIYINKIWIVLIGALITLAVFLKKQLYSNLQLQLLYLAAILMFTVLFNPGVESPTYIICVAGVALWYINKPRTTWEKWLAILVFIFTCLSPTELFPRFIKQHFFVPYHIKAVPCVITWLVCMYEIFTFSNTEKNNTLPA
jgi:hypothetical protein